MGGICKAQVIIELGVGGIGALEVVVESDHRDVGSGSVGAVRVVGCPAISEDEAVTTGRSGPVDYIACNILDGYRNNVALAHTVNAVD